MLTRGQAAGALVDAIERVLAWRRVQGQGQPGNMRHDGLGGKSVVVNAEDEGRRGSAARWVHGGCAQRVRRGRNGWMIARLQKDGTFDSWVEE